MITIADPTPVGDLREWRRLRNLSQLELALRAGTSARHLSFLETGRAQPSREMVLNLAQQLGVPLRVRNDLLLAAGFAPVYRETGLGEPALAAARSAFDRLLVAHEPYPAIVVDFQRNIISSNRGLVVFTEGAAPELLEPPINSLRLALHPRGMAPRVVNFGGFSYHVMEGLASRIATTGDERLRQLQRELTSYPGVVLEQPIAPDPMEAVAVPILLRFRGHELHFYNTFTTFAMPRDITLTEIALEAFYPVNPETAEVLNSL